jgi:BMFP domain-containing protein YqiC
MRLAFPATLRYQMRMATTPIEELARKLADSVPDSVRGIKNDLEENFRSVLRGGLNKLDLVTREEFEVQEAVLARTREKLEALEVRLKELENP